MPKAVIVDGVNQDLYLELPGEFPNGARIQIRNQFAQIYILGIDTADDLVTIIAAARQAGAIGGSLHTGTIVNDQELARLIDLSERSSSRLGGRVFRIGPDRFRIDFEELPDFGGDDAHS